MVEHLWKLTKPASRMLSRAVEANKAAIEDIIRRRIMGGYKTVTASEGYEFKITSVYGAGTGYSTSYEDGSATTPHTGFQDRVSGLWQRWRKPTIELVPIAEPTRRPKGECPLCKGLEPEPEAWKYEWEIDGAELKSVDRYDTLHMDNNGRWEVRWYGRGNTYGVTGAGQAKRVQ